MKKFLALALLVLMVATLFVGCGSKEKFKCDSCGKEVESVKYEVEILGKEAEICEDCNELIEEAKEATEELLGK